VAAGWAFGGVAGFAWTTIPGYILDNVIEVFHHRPFFKTEENSRKTAAIKDLDCDACKIR
jgi:preprotein translocase subunit SecD